MSVSSIIASNQKIFDSLLPNPYPYPAQPNGLGAVLQTDNRAGDQDIIGVDNLQVAKVDNPLLGGNLTIGGAGQDLRIQGATNKGSLLVGNGTSSVEIPVGANGLILKANSATATGLEWGADAQGGTVEAVNAGTNINVGGTISQPIVNLASPLTSTLGMGTVALTDKVGSSGTAGQVLTAGTGGETLWATLSSGGINSVQAGTNISVNPTDPLNPIVSISQPLTTDLFIEGQAIQGFSTDTISQNETLILQTTNGIDTKLSFSHSDTAVPNTLLTELSCAPTLTKLKLNTYDNATLTTSDYENVATLGGTTQSIQISSPTSQFNSTINSGSNSQVEQTTITDATVSNQRQEIINASGTSNTYVYASGGTTQSTNFQVGATNSLTTQSYSQGATTIFQQSEASSVQARSRVVYTNATTLNSQGMTTNFGGCDFRQSAGATDFLLSTQTGGDTSISSTANITMTADNIDIGTSRFIYPTLTGSANYMDYNTTGVGTSGRLLLRQTAQGGQTNPILALQNSNLVGGVSMDIYKNKPGGGVNGDSLFVQSVYGNDNGATKKEYTRVSHTIRASSAGQEDGSIEMGCFVNGSYTNFIQLNGNDNLLTPNGEVNVLRPIDLSTDSQGIIKTSGTGSQNLILDASTSVGNGVIELRTKNATGGLTITGDKTQSNTAGGSSGQHLVITLNGNVYKIALLNP